MYDDKYGKVTGGEGRTPWFFGILGTPAPARPYGVTSLLLNIIQITKLMYSDGSVLTSGYNNNNNNNNRRLVTLAEHTSDHRIIYLYHIIIPPTTVSYIYII